jgi:hypothetical protein
MTPLKIFLEFSLFKKKSPQKEPPTCKNLPPKIKTKNIVN